jgi:hypothetical protein
MVDSPARALAVGRLDTVDTVGGFARGDRKAGHTRSAHNLRRSLESKTLGYTTIPFHTVQRVNPHGVTYAPTGRTVSTRVRSQSFSICSLLGDKAVEKALMGKIFKLHESFYGPRRTAPPAPR